MAPQHAASALSQLAEHYRNGIGVPADIQEAKRWLKRLLQILRKDGPSYREASKMLHDLDQQFL